MVYIKYVKPRHLLLSFYSLPADLWASVSFCQVTASVFLSHQLPECQKYQTYFKKCCLKCLWKNLLLDQMLMLFSYENLKKKFLSNFSSHFWGIQKRQISLPVGYNTSQDGRLGIVEIYCTVLYPTRSKIWNFYSLECEEKYWSWSFFWFSNKNKMKTWSSKWNKFCHTV